MGCRLLDNQLGRFNETRRYPMGRFVVCCWLGMQHCHLLHSLNSDLSNNSLRSANETETSSGFAKFLCLQWRLPRTLSELLKNIQQKPWNETITKIDIGSPGVHPWGNEKTNRWGHLPLLQSNAAPSRDVGLDVGGMLLFGGWASEGRWPGSSELSSLATSPDISGRTTKNADVLLFFCDILGLKIGAQKLGPNGQESGCFNLVVVASLGSKLHQIFP